MSQAAQFCVIRKFKDGDQSSIKSIITEATMEQVGSFFWGAVFSEAMLQLSVVVMAVTFIFFGVPFKYCLLAIPFAFVLLYIIVWMGHWIKAAELHDDLNNIHGHYMSDSGTTFLVAEVFGKSGEAELASIMNKVKKVEYQFYTEKEKEESQVNTKGLRPLVVGTIAVTRSTVTVNYAWIRRMAVSKTHRRRHIATALLTEAIRFCKDQKHDGVELVTTECHAAARELCYREGFESLDTSNKSYFGIGSNQTLRLGMRLKKLPKENVDVEEAETV